MKSSLIVAEDGSVRITASWRQSFLSGDENILELNLGGGCIALKCNKWFTELKWLMLLAEFQLHNTNNWFYEPKHFLSHFLEGKGRGGEGKDKRPQSTWEQPKSRGNSASRALCEADDVARTEVSELRRHTQATQTVKHNSFQSRIQTHRDKKKKKNPPRSSTDDLHCRNCRGQ